MAEAHTATLWNWARVPKRVWGPVGWNWLHRLAINYPVEPTLQEALSAFNEIWTFAECLPCAECRREALRYITAIPPDMQSTYSLQEWARVFHNSVNLRLKKPQMSQEAYKLAYADEILRASVFTRS